MLSHGIPMINFLQPQYPNSKSLQWHGYNCFTNTPRHSWICWKFPGVLCCTWNKYFLSIMKRLEMFVCLLIESRHAKWDKKHQKHIQVISLVPFVLTHANFWTKAPPQSLKKTVTSIFIFRRSLERLSNIPEKVKDTFGCAWMYFSVAWLSTRVGEETKFLKLFSQIHPWVNSFQNGLW